MRSFNCLAVIAISCASTGCLDRDSADRGPTAVSVEASALFPALTGRVVDEASILSPDEALDLTAKSEALEAATMRQFVIVTVRSLNGRDVASYTTDLGNVWRIGDKGRQDGVILLVAPNERQVRIAVGDGLARVLTNEEAAKIIQRDILPRFRSGNLQGGISTGADAVIAQLSRPSQSAN
jgi:uncharacterized protein